MNGKNLILALDAYHETVLTIPLDGREILFLRIRNTAFIWCSYHFERGLESYLVELKGIVRV